MRVERHIGSRLLESQAARLSSPGRVPCRFPPAPPAPLPPFLNNVLTDLPSGSARRTLTPALQIPLLPLPHFCLPGPGTTHADISVGMLPPFGSTHTKPGSAHPLTASPGNPRFGRSPQSSLPGCGANIPGSARWLLSHKAPWRIPRHQQSVPPFPTKTPLDQTALHDAAPSPATRSSTQEGLTPPWARFARQTSPETADYGPGCVPAAPFPRLAQREYLDVAAIPRTGFSLVPAAPLPGACRINPSAIPACSQKIRSAPQALLVFGWLPAFRLICPAVLINAPTVPPSLRAESYIRWRHAACSTP